MKACHVCGTEWTEPDAPGFSAECEKCAAWLHCCRNCKFHSPGAHNDCRETQSDPVRDNEGKNHCEYFVLADRESGGSDDASRAAQARAKLDELFHKPGEA